MIYLEKTTQEAINFVTNFIDANWLEQNDGSYKYQNIGYPQVKNPVNQFRGYFVDEQHGKCCYCCREILNNNSTELEHIIPRTKSEIGDFIPYYNLSVILRNNVVPQSVFETSDVQLIKPPFPHHIAYHNIVASCNGRTFESSESFTCCNRERGDDFIPPFNVMPDAINYLPDGTIVYMNDVANRDYFEILNLNKGILNNIRRLWFLFSESQLTLDEILQDNNDVESIREKVVQFGIANSVTPSVDVKLVQTFSNQGLWDTFIKYSYFLDYYRGLN